MFFLGHPNESIWDSQPFQYVITLYLYRSYITLVVTGFWTNLVGVEYNLILTIQKFDSSCSKNSQGFMKAGLKAHHHPPRPLGNFPFDEMQQDRGAFPKCNLTPPEGAGSTVSRFFVSSSWSFQQEDPTRPTKSVSGTPQNLTKWYYCICFCIKNMYDTYIILTIKL